MNRRVTLGRTRTGKDITLPLDLAVFGAIVAVVVVVLIAGAASGGELSDSSGCAEYADASNDTKDEYWRAALADAGFSEPSDRMMRYALGLYSSVCGSARAAAQNPGVLGDTVPLVVRACRFDC